MTEWHSTVTPPALARLLRTAQAPAGPGHPVYRALARQVQLLLTDGRLPVGTRMPAERELAAALAVSRTTIAAAYDALRETGYLHSRRGSGSWTALPEGSRPPVDALFPVPPEGAGQVIDLGAATPPAPQPLFTEATARAVEQLPAYAQGHGHYPTGIPALREAVADRFTQRGLPTTPDQILITSGAMSALVLVFGALLRPGERVAVETPSYAHVLQALRNTGARLVPVPQRRDDPCGMPRWDLTEWRQVMRGAAPRLAYVIPDFHNPTGALIDEQQRRDLLAAARSAGTLVVVDETMAELAWRDPALQLPRPTAGLDRAAQLITVGSASKLAWGGLRVGWVRAAPALIRQLAAERLHHDHGTAVLEQLICAHLLGERLPALRELRLGQLRAGAEALLPALRERLPQWRFAEPAGGITLWVDTGGLSGTAIARAGERTGVRVAPGALFGLDGAFEGFVRLPLTVPPAAAAQTVERLAATAELAAREDGRGWAGTLGTAAALAV
ncbi:PLP-dependent aminotransferase family protein [Kitasatospora acidiphila]|uniref:PLP-dependent aminotransferase family protein n=1 Tax=Kitasatospora acidiphila TaxID=2567942 RepID=A0A540W1I3_9ACTN|nr:PLP-dependent aminotransferase family protein [Kitasatospora acidiphila]TQF02890.1 PLP-dependent aminotransferase family protein [Kitasatospora acidiphila]